MLAYRDYLIPIFIVLLNALSLKFLNIEDQRDVVLDLYSTVSCLIMELVYILCISRSYFWPAVLALVHYVV